MSGLKSPSDSFVNAAYEFSGLSSIVESANDVVAAVFRGDVSSEFIVLQSIIVSSSQLTSLLYPNGSKRAIVLSSIFVSSSENVTRDLYNLELHRLLLAVYKLVHGDDDDDVKVDVDTRGERDDVGGANATVKSSDATDNRRQPITYRMCVG